MKQLIKHLLGTPSIHCIWCGADVPCIGHVPFKCPFCGHSL